MNYQRSQYTGILNQLHLDSTFVESIESVLHKKKKKRLHISQKVSLELWSLPIYRCNWFWLCWWPPTENYAIISEMPIIKVASSLPAHVKCLYLIKNLWHPRMTWFVMPEFGCIIAWFRCAFRNFRKEVLDSVKGMVWWLSRRFVIM